MMRYFFVGIPSLLFEPIAVGAFFGVVISVLFYYKKHDRFYWTVIFTIFFMLLWRLSVHTLMRSTRYASILLYPAVIFTALFCFHLRNIANWGAEKNKRLNTLCCKKIIFFSPILIVSGLTVASLVKTLHYNPYGKHTMKLCKVLSEEIQGKDFLLYTSIERERIAYYAGLDIRKVQQCGNSVMPSINDLLKNQILSYKNFFEPSYFIFYQKKGMPEPDTDTLEIPAEVGKWECLYREYTSRRKNKEIVLYRFIPAHPNIEIWENKIPEMSSGNLCTNGDFELYLTGIALDKRIAYFRKLGASDFYLTPDRLFPTAWWIDLWKSATGRFSEIALTADNPIAGKYSLEIDVDSGYCWSINNFFIPKQNFTVSGFLQAKSDSTIIIQPRYQDIDAKRSRIIKTYTFRLRSDRTYRFSFPVYKSDVPEKGGNICISVTGKGHVLLDNVEFIPEQKNIKREIKK